MNVTFFTNVAYVNLSVLGLPKNITERTEFMITVDPNVEFTIDSVIEKFELFHSKEAILLSLSYNKNGDSMRLESWNQKFILNKGAVLYIKVTLPLFFDGKTVGGYYFTFTSPFQCYPYFYISHTISEDSLSFQEDFFEYSKLLEWRGYLSEKGSYYPMRKEYKSAHYAAITTACGARYTFFKIKENSVSKDFVRHKFVASESQWKNFHSNFVEVITLE